MDVAEEGQTPNRSSLGGMNLPIPSPPSSCKVYTPVPLAEAMIDAIRDSELQNWLEPSFGKGVFVEALAAYGTSRDRITAIDLDLDVSDADGLANTVRGEDFLRWSRTRHGRFSCVVGNPPYVAIGTLQKSLMNQAASIKGLDERPIGVRANTWYAFATEAIRCLKYGGSLALVLPASCEYSDYATSGRNCLSNHFGRVDLIRSRRPMFEGVQEGSVVLVARKKGSDEQLFRRHVVDDIDAVVERLNTLPKLSARKCPEPSNRKDSNKEVALSEIIKVRLGGVTGDAKYFLLSESKRRDLGMPKSALVPVVSRSRHIGRSNLSLREWNELKEQGESVWLFRPTGKSLAHKSVQDYLALEKLQGGCNQGAYKVKNRNPWYVTPLPSKADGFFTGMSANGLWFCMNDMHRLSATNTLYVATFIDDLSRQRKYAWAISLLTSVVAKQVARATRVYAHGLTKIEPGQIVNLRVPVPGNIGKAVSSYKKICEMYLTGEKRMAIALADSQVFGLSAKGSRIRGGRIS